MSQHQQPETEILQFKIGLSGTFWDKQPNFSVLVNDVEYAKGTVASEVQYINFSAELVEKTDHELKIRLENKTDKDTVVGDDGNIVKDMLLNIESIEIDDIELSQLKWSLSEFIPDDTTNRPVLTSCLNLGWNGTYILKFDSPYYLWLLEKL